VDPGPLRDALTLALGVATGALSGLFGVGGAVISTPGIRALGASALIAVGTTLPSIIPGAAAGTARYSRERLIDWRVVQVTAPAGILAAIVGSLLTRVVPGNGHLLQLLTAVLLGFSAYRMFGASNAPPPDPETDVVGVLGGEPDLPDGQPADPPAGEVHRSRLRFGAVGAVAGLLSGLLGIGGGIVMVPGFVTVAHMRVKDAIATSLACVGIFAVPGTITHAVRGDIDWRFALLLAVGVIPGTRLGASLAIRAADHRLRVIVGVFLGVTAVAYAAGELLALR
jgi:uncharacterized membrane protein YfcA